MLGLGCRVLSLGPSFGRRHFKCGAHVRGRLVAWQSNLVVGCGPVQISTEGVIDGLCSFYGMGFKSLHMSSTRCTCFGVYS